MYFHELAETDASRQLSSSGLEFVCGPFTWKLRARHDPLASQLRSLYAHTTVTRRETPTSLINFHLSLYQPGGLRRFWRPQILMVSDAITPFEPFPYSHALPLFEWSLNWLIATQAHHFLMLHSAVVEKDGVAIIMPALPGSGKSTLSSALMLRGWRLLSDEFGIIRPNDPDLMLHPLPRPIPLKNRSIEVIRNFSDEAIIGPTFPKTRKGDVAHLAATAESQLRGQDKAIPGWFLFPRYASGAATKIEALAKGWTFLKISGNSFNYKLQGARGFRAVTGLVDRCPSYSLSYSDLDEAIPAIESIHRQVLEHRSNAARPASQ